ncbi:LytR C-terminal domain-containing protein [Leptospira sp. 2 VSF19]|uniref:LytR C-terminal domain-containing protein n=1 Tax=Leptospira soteropolitanensis TaxID=2950025 RepID=A0AAW5VKG8_9LEPT|nr:LytR C-terminal domain-containing protein [Leptospira soteropolitanensis]MCW7492106.1 LytR C-terminal domain-containing protein [Leptospira soteropolitanensis]MCW7499688.1 LytR C-terminal domain-containing protein [Leptospira soteropolitanensis]MCW7521939.1 LytR C-terminal domain-containing protein [Leptospira soteropolitanensis]MCW7525793.1 LytR C-terminal domain-containing protein [Leptospira soteropolitanensis]MCW7530093.1 LytR C-terminal domain-containing protein [Leptospira soteropolit
MLREAPKKQPIPAKTLLIAAGAFFLFALLFLVLRSKGGFSLDQKFSQSKRLPILFSVLGDKDEYLFSLYAEFYPNEKKAALFFVNPKTSFDDGDKSLKEKGSSAPSYVESVLEDTLDSSIPFKIVWTKEQFQNSINLLGGLNLFFEPKSLHITKNYARNKQTYVLDGEDTFDWMSSLADESMISYIRRLEIQETVFLTVLEAIHEKKDLLGKQRVAYLHSQMTTNLSIKEWETFIEFLKKEKIHFGVSEVPGEPMGRPKLRDEVLKANEETVKVAFHKFASELRSLSFSEGERARIEVLNGTPKNGLARYGKVLLNDKGLKVLSVDNAWDSSFKSSIILNRSGNTQYTDLISDTFQGRRVFFALRKDLGLDATVILGEDFQNSKD